MTDEALRRGLALFGISEHGPGTPGGASCSYFLGLKLLPRRKGSLIIRYGAEANIMDIDGKLDLPDHILKELDYVIAGIHPRALKHLDREQSLRVYIGAMKNPFVTFIAHPDDSRYEVDYNAFVSACLKYRCVPELNEISVSPASYRKDSRKNVRNLLKACMLYNCPVLISSDSHGRKGIGEATHAEELIKDLSFPEELIFNSIIRDRIS